MEFAFDHTERNVPLDDEIFRFTPPQGTEIIDQAR
jgi:outer membrane lipoprotein-sorting protein